MRGLLPREVIGQRPKKLNMEDARGKRQGTGDLHCAVPDKVYKQAIGDGPKGLAPRPAVKEMDH